MAVPLDREQVADRHAAQLRDAAHVVAREIDEHDVFGALFGVGEEFGRERRVLFRRGASAARAGERAGW